MSIVPNTINGCTILQNGKHYKCEYISLKDANFKCLYGNNNIPTYNDDEQVAFAKGSTDGDVLKNNSRDECVKTIKQKYKYMRYEVEKDSKTNNFTKKIRGPWNLDDIYNIKCKDGKNDKTKDNLDNSTCKSLFNELDIKSYKDEGYSCDNKIYSGKIPIKYELETGSAYIPNTINYNKI
jgi:hypothetical protein